VIVTAFRQLTAGSWFDHLHELNSEGMDFYRRIFCQGAPLGEQITKPSLHFRVILTRRKIRDAITSIISICSADVLLWAVGTYTPFIIVVIELRPKKSNTMDVRTNVMIQ
jgi:hypothetical protein